MNVSVGRVAPVRSGQLVQACCLAYAAAVSPSSTLTEGEIDRVVERYREAMIRYEEAAIAVEARLRRELRAATLRALLSSRAKHPDEVRRKLLRKRSDDSSLSFGKIERNLNEVVR